MSESIYGDNVTLLLKTLQCSLSLWVKPESLQWPTRPTCSLISYIILPPYSLHSPHSFLLTAPFALIVSWNSLLIWAWYIPLFPEGLHAISIVSEKPSLATQWLKHFSWLFLFLLFPCFVLLLSTSQSDIWYVYSFIMFLALSLSLEYIFLVGKVF